MCLCLSIADCYWKQCDSFACFLFWYYSILWKIVRDPIRDRILVNVDVDSCIDDWQRAGRSLVCGVGTWQIQLPAAARTCWALYKCVDDVCHGLGSLLMLRCRHQVRSYARCAACIRRVQPLTAFTDVVQWNVVQQQCFDYRHMYYYKQSICNTTCSECLIYALLFIQIKKPLIERRRRERINDSLNQLKNLVLEATNKDVSRRLLFS